MVARLIRLMAEYYGTDRALTNHALKVYALARAIGEGSGLAGQEMETLLLGAVLHDIGIPEARRRFESSAGKYQELLGPDIAQQLLERAGAQPAQVERVRYLVGHHHSYDCPGDDLRVLFEADLLVNLDEGGADESACRTAAHQFHTECGRALLREMFNCGGIEA